MRPAFEDGATHSSRRFSRRRSSSAYGVAAPGGRQERIDHKSLAFFCSAIVNKLCDRHIKHTQSEWTEYADRTIVLFWRSRTACQSPDRAADKVAASRLLLRKMNRRLRTTDVIGIVHDVVRVENDFR